MKDFEKALRDLPKPDLPTAEFKRSLRAELGRAQRQRERNGYRRSFLATAAAGVVLLALLGTFVWNPEIPRRLHAVLGGPPGGSAGLSGDDGNGRAVPGGSVPAAAVAQNLEALFRQSDATAEIDRSAVESWYQQQALPVGVVQMEAEQIYAVRQFRLTNGERILVFTELGQEVSRPSLSF